MDPNKYKENADIRPESLIKTLMSVGSMVLMLIGIIGIGLDFFKEDSLIKKALAYLFQSTSTMMLIPLIAFILWLLNRWLSSPNKNEKKKKRKLTNVFNDACWRLLCLSVCARLIKNEYKNKAALCGFIFLSKPIDYFFCAAVSA